MTVCDGYGNIPPVVDYDRDSFLNSRWPQLGWRLQSAVDAFATALDNVAKESVMGPPESKTLRGTHYITYGLGGAAYEGNFPTMLSIVGSDDEAFVRGFVERYLDPLFYNLAQKLEHSPRLVWRLKPTIRLQLPPTQEELAETYHTTGTIIEVPAVWMRMRLAMESLQ